MLAVAVLASVPWQGIAYLDHTVTRLVPLGNTGLVLLQRRFVPICIHMDWRLRRSMQAGSRERRGRNDRVAEHGGRWCGRTIGAGSSATRTNASCEMAHSMGA